MYMYIHIWYLEPRQSRTRVSDHHSKIFIVKIHGKLSSREKLMRWYDDMTRRVDWHAAIRGTARDESLLKITKILRNNSEWRIMIMRKAMPHRQINAVQGNRLRWLRARDIGNIEWIFCPHNIFYFYECYEIRNIHTSPWTLVLVQVLH